MDAPCIYACVPVVVRRWYLRVEMRLVKARTFTAPRNLLIELATRTVRAPAKKGYGFSSRALSSCATVYLAQNDITSHVA